MKFKLYFVNFAAIVFNRFSGLLKKQNVECVLRTMNQIENITPSSHSGIIVKEIDVELYLKKAQQLETIRTMPLVVMLKSAQNVKKISVLFDNIQNTDFVVNPVSGSEIVARFQLIEMRQSVNQSRKSIILSKNKEDNKIYSDFKRVSHKYLHEKAKREYLENRLACIQNNENYNIAANEFISNLNHEIRTPLNVIIGFTEIIKNKLNKNHNVLEYVNEIEFSASAMLNLFNDLLDLSRIELGKLEIVKEIASPLDMAYEIKNLFDNEAKDKNLELNIVVDKNMPRNLLFDKKRIKQVLIQLVGNAIKYTDSGAITITLFPEKVDTAGSLTNLYIEVQDTGSGIPKTLQEKIFIPFLSSENANRKKNNGIGIGLTLAKKLMGLMGGFIDFTSYENIGTVFRISLKDVAVAAFDISNSKNSIQKNAIETLKNKKVIYADDTLLNREMVKEYLNSFGVEVLLAENGKKLLDKLDKHKPDAIILDEDMPYMKGIEIARKLKQSVINSSIPLIALTAVSEEYYKKIPDANEMYNIILHKPVSNIKLLNTICELTEPNNHSEKMKKSIQNNINYPVRLQNLIVNKQVNNYEQFKLQFNNEILPLYQNACKTMFIDEIKVFSTQLTNFGVKYNLLPFENLGKQLVSDVNSFNIESINKRLPVVKEMAKIIEGI